MVFYPEIPMRGLTSLTVCLALLTSTDAKCPEGSFSGVGDFDCYQLSKETAEYSQALTDCIAMNGALPTIPNALTKSVLAAKAPKGGIWLLDSILNKNLVTGVWTIRWSDYSVSDLNHWAKSLTSVDEERRFALMPNEELKTISFDSNVTKSYICKVAPVLAFPAVAKDSKSTDLECQKGWTRLKSADKCVKLDNSTVTWLEGLQRCRKLGGDLVHVKSAAIEKELTGLFTDDVDRLTRFYAIGLYRPISSDVWTYTDGTAIGDFTGFSFAPPSTWGRCAFISTVTQVVNVQTMTIRQKKDPSWVSRPCVYYGGFICERPTHALEASDDNNPKAPNASPTDSHRGPLSGFLGKLKSALKKGIEWFKHLGGRQPEQASVFAGLGRVDIEGQPHD